MSEKKKILIFIDWFLPGYKAGGPIRSVANIVNALHKIFDFYIITSDRDFGCNKPYKNIEINTFIQKNNCKILYLSPENQTKTNLINIIKNLDFNTVYFNSLFSVKYTLLPLRLIKKYKKNANIILAPRGMLGQGALSLKKGKKKLFLIVSKFLNLYKNITWHATDEVEVTDILKYYGKQSKTVLVPNISEKIKPCKTREKHITKFIFLSRIAEKKNLLSAIEFFLDVKTNKKVFFSIYGTNEEDDYLTKCKMKAQKAGENIKIEFKGEIPHENVHKTLTEYHFYILPTLHENFGHSIFEAFSAGCPVIISDQTPWRNLEKKEIGWDIPLNNKKKFQEIIQRCIDMKQEEYDIISKNAFNFAKNFSENSQATADTEKMFKNE
ncbi:MAG: glycosyltransferase [Chlorobi bacterium]|nr:glycosyltransferase [Chlorobiota bacterium]